MSVSSVGSSTTVTNSTNSTASTGTTGSSSSSGSGASTGSGLLSSLGIGSGLDVTAIINALVNAAQSGPAAQLNAQAEQDDALGTALTALQQVLTGMQADLYTLSSSGTYATYDASFAGSGIGTATTNASATAGTYDVDVTSLAVAQKSLSGPVSGNSPVGSGTLDISVGSSKMTVTVSASATLSDVAASINSSSSNPGVIASVINGAGGQQLVLTSSSTGVANAFTVSAESGSSSGLSSIATALSTPSTAAADAKLSIDGVAVTSASNTVSGALSGVTLNLTASGSTQLTVSQDTSVISKAVSGFATDYNTYIETVHALTAYSASGASGSTAGPLLGDTMLTTLESQISSVIGSVVQGNAIGSLASLGITRSDDQVSANSNDPNAWGLMSIDPSMLSAALTSNPAAVQNLFAGTNGIATKLNSAISVYTGGDGSGLSSGTGLIQSRQTNLATALTGLSTQQTALTARMAVYREQLTQQYTALDTLVTSLNSTSSYLTQSLQAMNNANSNNN